MLLWRVVSLLLFVDAYGVGSDLWFSVGFNPLAVVALLPH